MSRGPLPKPHEVKERQGNPGKQQLVKRLEAAPSGVGKPHVKRNEKRGDRNEVKEQYESCYPWRPDPFSRRTGNGPVCNEYGNRYDNCRGGERS